MPHRWHGLRAAARIARRDAVRSRGRTTLVAVLVGLPVFVCVAGATLLQSGQMTWQTALRYELGTEAQAVVEYVDARVIGNSFPPQGGVDLEDLARPLDTVEARAAALRAIAPDGDELAERHLGYARLRTSDGRANTTLQAIDSRHSTALLRGNVVEGRAPAGPDEIVLTRALAERLGVSVGDVVDAAGQSPERRAPDEAMAPMRVVGVVRPWPGDGDSVTVTTDSALDPIAARLPEADVGMSWAVLGPAAVTWDDVATLNAAGFTVGTRHALTVSPPPADPALMTPREAVPAATLAIAAAAVGLGLLEVALLIGPAFAVGARRSQRQLALLAAVGGDRRTLRDVVLLGGLVTGLAAALGGALLGVLTAAGAYAFLRHQDSSAVLEWRAPWLAVVGFVALGTAIATCAAWLPARRAARVDVVAALTGRRSEARPRRRVPIIGAILVAMGGLVALWGALDTQTVALVGGVLMLQLGVVTSSGGIVSLVGRLAPRLGVAGRVALRDASRQRGRTAPAVAAVLAAVAGAMAGTAYFASLDTGEREAYTPVAADGVVLINDLGGEPGDDEPHDLDARVTRLETVTTRVLPGAPSARLQVALAPPPATAEPGVEWSEPQVVYSEGQQCPAWLHEDREEARQVVRDDPRCWGLRKTTPDLSFGASHGWSRVLVDDGAAWRVLGLPGADQAARALEAGTVVVTPFGTRADGTAELKIWDDAVSTPAVDGAELGPWTAVLSPATAQRLGLTVEWAGIAVRPDHVLTSAEEDRLVDALPASASVVVERGWSSPRGLLQPLLVGGGILLAVAATGIAVALAGAESAPDLATLAAVGASPRTRRRVAAAQAGVVAVIGSWLGVAAGVALGAVLVVASRQREFQVTTRLDVPWTLAAALALAAPAVAMAGAYALTRSRLPLTRRRPS